MSSENRLSQEDKRKLLAIARASVEATARGGKSGPAPDQGPALNEARGAFVTLHRQGRLRGCIGNFTAQGPLKDNVREMAAAAAAHDPRFPPVKPAEMEEIDLEISVLSPLRPVEDVSEIEVGTHGIYIVSPRGRGVLLPQVATEWGWDRDTFLDQTCVKAGLQPGCWRAPGVQILVFSAEVFGEKDLG